MSNISHPEDDKFKFMTFFLFFLENRLWHFMQIVSLGDSLHEISKSFFPGKNKKKYFKTSSTENFTQHARR